MLSASNRAERCRLYRDPGRLCFTSHVPSGKSHYGACYDVICPIRTHRRRSSWRGHIGSSARADNDAPIVNIFEGRRCLEMDIEAMESGKGQVVRGKGKMG